MPRLRFSLVFFLLLIGVVGAGLGLIAMRVLAYYNETARYFAEDQFVECGVVQAMWEEKRSGESRMVFLAVLPKGDQAIVGGGRGPQRIDPRERVIHAEGPGMTIHPSGIYWDQKYLPRSSEGTVWIYRTSKQTVEQIPLPPGFGQPPISRAEFQNFRDSKLWRDVLRPIAEEESDAFYAKMGVPRPRRGVVRTP